MEIVLTGEEVISSLQKVGMNITDFKDMVDGEKGLPIIYTTKIDANEVLPFLFGEGVDLVVSGGVGLRNNLILLIMEYNYKHYRGSNGHRTLLRSNDGGKTFLVE